MNDQTNDSDAGAGARGSRRADAGAGAATLPGRDQEPTRVAVVADAIEWPAGVRHPLAQLLDRDIPGHDLEVITPSLTGIEEAMTERRYELLHVCAPSPVALAALDLALIAGIPAACSFATAGHSESALAPFYGQCEVIFSPGPVADAALRQRGIEGRKIRRLEPGLDRERFHPARYCPDALSSDTVNVLHVGSLACEHGGELLADAFLLARDREPRLHLFLVSSGPDEPRLATRLGHAATFLGAVQEDALARLYASADLLVFMSGTDPFGQVILEAQASGLPVLSVDAGDPAQLIESGRSGCLVPPEPEPLASAIRGLGRRAAVRDRLATGGLLSVRERGLQLSLEQLVDGWRIAARRRPRARGVPSAA